VRAASAILAVAVVVTSCAAPDPTVGSPRIARATIVIPTYRFEPATLEVARGTIVTWENHDQDQHVLATSPTVAIPFNPDQSYDLSASRFVLTLERGATASFTFNDAGTYHYYCLVQNTMRGVVVVR
jgi:plastocyanin